VYPWIAPSITEMEMKFISELVPLEEKKIDPRLEKLQKH